MNWDIIIPENVTLADLEEAKEYDFPDTYSGQSWRACWLMYHEGYKKDKEEFLKQDRWGNFPYLLNRNLGLTGFMVGWACNTLRKLLGRCRVGDGASVRVGAGDDQPVGVPSGNAETSLIKTLRGEK